MTHHFEPLPASFEFGDCLGRGSFGAVYRATGPKGEAVAIKFSHPEVRAKEMPRIQREIETIAGKSHPNLVGFLGAFEHPKHGVALVYELVVGRTLRALGSGPFEISQVLPWLEGLGAGVDTLHGWGLLHRDLKPENLMVEASGRLRILDYGLVKPEAGGKTLTQEGWVLGTPAYLAPEVLQGGRASTASDLFAVGAIAYELIEGEPFAPSDVPSLLRFYGPRRAGQRIPMQREELSPLFSRMLSVDPDQRPRDCREFLEELRQRCLKPKPHVAVTRERLPEAEAGLPQTRVISAGPSEALPRGSSGRSLDLSIKRPGLGWIGLGGLLLLLGGLFGVGAFIGPTSPPPRLEREPVEEEEKALPPKEDLAEALLRDLAFPEDLGARVDLFQKREVLMEHPRLDEILGAFLQSQGDLPDAWSQALGPIQERFTERGVGSPLESLLSFGLSRREATIAPEHERVLGLPGDFVAQGWVGAAVQAWMEFRDFEAKLRGEVQRASASNWKDVEGSLAYLRLLETARLQMADFHWAGLVHPYHQAKRRGDLLAWISPLLTSLEKLRLAVALAIKHQDLTEGEGLLLVDLSLENSPFCFPGALLRSRRLLGHLMDRPDKDILRLYQSEESFGALRFAGLSQFRRAHQDLFEYLEENQAKSPRVGWRNLVRIYALATQEKAREKLDPSPHDEALYSRLVSRELRLILPEYPRLPPRLQHLFGKSLIQHHGLRTEGFQIPLGDGPGELGGIIRTLRELSKGSPGAQRSVEEEVQALGEDG